MISLGNREHFPLSSWAQMTEQKQPLCHLGAHFMYCKSFNLNFQVGLQLVLLREQKGLFIFFY